MSQQKNANLIDSIQTEVAQEASPFLEFLVRNYKKFIILVLLIIAIAVAISGWRLYHENRTADAREKLGLILSRQDSNADLEALKTFAQDVNIAEIKIAAFLALSSAANQAGDFALAVSAWEETTRLVPAGSSMYYTAQIGIANDLKRQGKEAEALALLETLLSNAPVELTLTLNAAILDLAEKEGQWTKAAQACEAILNNGSANTDKTYWQQRLAHLKLKK